MDKRTSKSSRASNFALDILILRSVRPKIVDQTVLSVATETCLCGHRDMSLWPQRHVSVATERTVWSTIFGRTDLRISISKAKFDARLDFEVLLSISLQNNIKNLQNLKKIF